MENSYVDGELKEMDLRRIKGVLRKENQMRLLREAELFIEKNKQK